MRDDPAKYTKGGAVMGNIDNEKMNSIKSAIAYNLRALRISRGLSQEEIAKRCGLRQSAVAAWESGRSQPSLQMFFMLADFYGVTPDEIAGIKPAERAPAITTPAGEVVAEIPTKYETAREPGASSGQKVYAVLSSPSLKKSPRAARAVRAERRRREREKELAIESVAAEFKKVLIDYMKKEISEK